ncbi:hypothetical protein ATO12_23200 [Aquimarina atlantica]|uniref:GmrSD restriction endonucleases N-terminal domain-containing protein n=1 Tax=Aquimarina atlantica TaxID=1317122 RepID=A0A023BQT7_9FLAO|nr:DUF262 domain-containing protein [Aquimarina atlantica]EZH72361.1 hypothetical protein ATO12_23200 [Aquimarina atlantica]
MNKENKWYLDDSEDEEIDISFKEYDLTSAPNDFNIKTIYDFIESGVLKIPGFQRNFVWDIKRASKLIESLIIGLPVPQVFLFEEGRNEFLLIDGQQRLMTIYYFVKQKFPRKEKRTELRRIFAEKGSIPDDILHNKEYFTSFDLKLSEKLPDAPNKLKNLNYSTLGDHKTAFDLRTIRNVIIKQNLPPEDNSAVYEIFHRLNSGGVVLKPQEIRSSIYHSPFYEMLFRVNLNDNWRKLINRPNPDLHLKDIEIILRGFALLLDSKNYKPSMTKFLNNFSFKAKSFTKESIDYFEDLFISFIDEAINFGEGAFVSSKTNRINVSAYEAVFKALAEKAFKSKNTNVKKAIRENLLALYEDSEFSEATEKDTAGTKNVQKRIERAKQIL